MQSKKDYNLEQNLSYSPFSIPQAVIRPLNSVARTRPTERVKTLQWKIKTLFIKLMKYNIQSAKTHFQHTGFKSNCNKRCEVLENGWNFAMYLLYHIEQALTSPRSRTFFSWLQASRKLIMNLSVESNETD